MMAKTEKPQFLFLKCTYPWITIYSLVAGFWGGFCSCCIAVFCPLQEMVLSVFCQWFELLLNNFRPGKLLIKLKEPILLIEWDFYSVNISFNVCNDDKPCYWIIWLIHKIFCSWTLLSNSVSTIPMRSCSNCSTTPCLSWNRKSTSERV